MSPVCKRHAHATHAYSQVGNDGQFARMAEAIGEGWMAADARYTTNAARVANREELMPLLKQALSHQSAAHWIAKFESVHVPCGPVQNMQQVWGSPPQANLPCPLPVPPLHVFPLSLPCRLLPAAIRS